MSDYLNDIGKRAKDASRLLGIISEETKNRVLNIAADNIVKSSEEILQANRTDLDAAFYKGMPQALIDRLELTEERIIQMAAGMKKVALLDNPVGKILSEKELENGLKITKVSVPIGVIAIIYEARPNVTADAFALCFKSGNSVILRGGSDAVNSNMKITEIIRKTLKENGVPEDAVICLEDISRKTANDLMRLNEYVDLLIPRGNKNLIKSTIENSTVPVIETGSGNCHIYVDESANINMAAEIIFNAKTQRYGVCNACESLLINENIIDEALPVIAEKLACKNVEIRGDEKVCSLLANAAAATEADWGEEYLGPVISIKTVKDVSEAIGHINKYNTGHSDAIITENPENAEKFMNEVDSAAVYVNASTRFTDGFEFGLGAEIGISTQKLHARGPMGLDELTSYKYKITGNGQVRK